MTDWNMRGIFVLCTGRCGHKWVAPLPYGAECSVCGDRAGWDDEGQPLNVVAREPITVNISYVWDKLARRRARAIRANRRTPRKTATVVSLAARRLDGQRPEVPS
jgi:hypothetical protein